MRYYILIIMLKFSVCVFCQPNKEITFDDLAVINEKYFLAGFYNRPYTGIAINYFPMEKKVWYKYVIVKGLLMEKTEYYKSGEIKSLEKFDAKNKKDGVFLVLKETGDTCYWGNYKKDKKDGLWIEMINDTTKQYSIYKMGILSSVIDRKIITPCP